MSGAWVERAHRLPDGYVPPSASLSPPPSTLGDVVAEHPLVAFLRARWDEEEAAALAWPEDERRWQVVGDRHVTYKNGAHECVTAIDVSGQILLWWERINVKADRDGSLSEHIARHDPARVLADIATKREILTEHYIVQGFHRGGAGLVCTRCSDYADRGQLHRPELAPCRTVRLLALPYAGHVDYRPEWAPEDHDEHQEEQP